MQYTVEKPLRDFEFWAGAKETVALLTYSDIDTIEIFLEEMAADCEVIWSETEINDFFWFQHDEIADILGYDDFDQIIEECHSF